MKTKNYEYQKIKIRIRKTIVIVIFLSFYSIFSQQRGINMINNKSKDTIFLVENRRIKI